MPSFTKKKLVNCYIARQPTGETTSNGYDCETTSNGMREAKIVFALEGEGLLKSIEVCNAPPEVMKDLEEEFWTSHVTVELSPTGEHDSFKQVRTIGPNGKTTFGSLTHYLLILFWLIVGCPRAPRPD